MTIRKKDLVQVARELNIDFLNLTRKELRKKIKETLGTKETEKYTPLSKLLYKYFGLKTLEKVSYDYTMGYTDAVVDHIRKQDKNNIIKKNISTADIEKLQIGVYFSSDNKLRVRKLEKEGKKTYFDKNGNALKRRSKCSSGEFWGLKNPSYPGSCGVSKNYVGIDTEKLTHKDFDLITKRVGRKLPKKIGKEYKVVEKNFIKEVREFRNKNKYEHDRE